MCRFFSKSKNVKNANCMEYLNNATVRLDYSSVFFFLELYNIYVTNTVSGIE